MFCQNCGAKLADNDRFCGYCGMIRVGGKPSATSKVVSHKQQYQKMVSVLILVCAIVMAFVIVFMPLFSLRYHEESRYYEDTKSTKTLYTVRAFDSDDLGEYDENYTIEGRVTTFSVMTILLVMAVGVLDYLKRPLLRFVTSVVILVSALICFVTVDTHWREVTSSFSFEFWPDYYFKTYGALSYSGITICIVLSFALLILASVGLYIEKSNKKRTGV